jgi:DoxX-like family
MFTTYMIVTVLVAMANSYAAINDFLRAEFVLSSMDRLGIPEAQLLPLGVLKAAGAAGLLVGIGVPLVGVAAGLGLVLFFVGAIVTAVRAHWYAHIPQPAMFLLLAAGALVLRLASV